jgi:exopolysaccharide biosynthesis protein
MYARVASFNLGEGVDQTIDQIRSDVESGERPPGLEDAKAMMMLVDRSSGKSMGIVLFDSEDAMKRGDEALNAMSPSGGGSRTGVEFYEVAVQMTA